jgi:hypothetical protein
MPSSGMDEIDDKHLTETIAYALWRSYTLRMKHRSLDEARTWAQHVTAHLRTCGMIVSRHPPKQAHSTPKLHDTPDPPHTP